MAEVLDENRGVVEKEIVLTYERMSLLMDEETADDDAKNLRSL